ncbi:MAG: preprotein translocase subunit SecE [Clostridiales bacterium]|jgi:preprotein translocase subunit SecE|nr:preprotein translocase subunit SecE [Clostridiales bacterium]
MAAAAKEAKKPGKVKKFFSELFSELKKVSWPKFPTVLKQLWVVLLVVFIFLVFVSAVDYGLGLLHKLLISGVQEPAETAASILGLLR